MAWCLVKHRDNFTLTFCATALLIVVNNALWLVMDILNMHGFKVTKATMG
jgi:hypothetical protein